MGFSSFRLFLHIGREPNTQQISPSQLCGDDRQTGDLTTNFKLPSWQTLLNSSKWTFWNQCPQPYLSLSNPSKEVYHLQNKASYQLYHEDTSKSISQHFNALYLGLTKIDLLHQQHVQYLVLYTPSHTSNCPPQMHRNSTHIGLLNFI